MSIQTMQRVFDHSLLVGSARVVMLALADRCDQDDTCWPSEEDLARRARLDTERRIRQIVAEAEKAGEIYHRPGRGRGRTSLFLVCVGLDAHTITTRLVKRFAMEYADAELQARVLVARYQGAKQKQEARFLFLQNRKSGTQNRKPSAQNRKPVSSGIQKNPKETTTDTPGTPPRIAPHMFTDDGPPPQVPGPAWDATLDAPSVLVYREVCGITPSKVQRDQIIASVLAENLTAWRADCNYWVGQSYRRESVADLLDFHRRGGVEARRAEMQTKNKRSASKPYNKAPRTADSPSASNTKTARNGVKYYE